MRLLTHFSLMILVSLGAVKASEIPGYIGSQSFRLSDDQDLEYASRRVDDAKRDYARYEQNENQIESELRRLESEQRSIQEKMAQVLREVESLKSARSSLASKIDELKRDPVTNADAIAQAEKELQSLAAQIDEKNRLAGAIKLEGASVNVRVDQVRNDFNMANRKTEEARQRYQVAVRDRDNYRAELIDALARINAEGARVGQNDGGNDGAQLSARLGYERGERDGSTDGFGQGTSDGQDRYYRRGAEQGERDGAARARIDGERDGTKEGIDSGNRTAGSREGRAAGIKRADASNAAQVGIEQGKVAGMDRAIKTGQVQGKNIGETETTRKMESGELKSVNLDGAFAGSFTRRSPDYPGDFNGSNYRPSIGHSKSLMRMAYADGYEYTYRQYTRYEFQRRIDSDYNQKYDSSYRAAYDDAVNRQYPAYYEQGRKDGDANAYKRDYPIVKAEAYRVAFERMNSAPNRASAEFKNAYASSELSAYNERYEAIRSANFDRVEAEVFAANIAAQTEIYRQKRIVEVTAIYNGNAIIQFVSSEMLDGGINGVALLDGVFQPSETTNHNVVLRNFGFKAAENVSVTLAGGQAVKLPAIPARSLVMIKGAGQGSVNASLGSTYKSSLKLVSALSTKDPVEGRHFEQLNGGIVKIADEKTAKVAYPLALSSLSLESQLLKGAKNKLKITLSNNSKREYKGDIRVKLATDSREEIITKEFGAVSTLQTSANLSDAEILVSSEEDAYRDLRISAKVFQNGVLIGVLSQDFVTMAKAKFADKGKVPVLVANTDSHLKAFLDALEDLGGSDKVSILDLSLAALNAETLANGLSQKVLLIVDDEKGSSIKTLNAFIGKSKSSTFTFIDEQNAGLKNVLTLGSLKDAPKLMLGKRSIVFSNQHRASGVVKSSAFIQSSLQTFKEDLKLAEMLAMTAPEMIAELKVKVSPENFSTPNETIRVFSLKALSEIMAINKAYDESGSIFSRDKKWVNMIKDDASLFHNQLKVAASGSVVVSKLPHILSAIAVKEAVSSAMDRGDGVYKDMMAKIKNEVNDVLGDMEKSYEKSLKKDFKELYNKAYAYKSIHNPFFIPTPVVTNN